MKATGVVRRLDDLGRIVIPKEIRTTMGIKEADPIEIFVNADTIILRKYTPGCVISGRSDDLVVFDGKLYNRDTVRQLAEAAQI